MHFNYFSLASVVRQYLILKPLNKLAIPFITLRYVYTALKITKLP